MSDKSELFVAQLVTAALRDVVSAGGLPAGPVGSDRIFMQGWLIADGKAGGGWDEIGKVVEPGKVEFLPDAVIPGNLRAFVEQILAEGKLSGSVQAERPGKPNFMNGRCPAAIFDFVVAAEKPADVTPEQVEQAKDFVRGKYRDDPTVRMAFRLAELGVYDPAA